MKFRSIMFSNKSRKYCNIIQYPKNKVKFFDAPHISLDIMFAVNQSLSIYNDVKASTTKQKEKEYKNKKIGKMKFQN